MNAKKLIAAVAMFAAAASVFADNNDLFVDSGNPVSTKTRAEVRAEVEKAYTQGALARNAEFADDNRVASTLSRDEVRKEAVQAAKRKQAAELYIGG
jgi:hypothetical protein